MFLLFLKSACLLRGGYQQACSVLLTVMLSFILPYKFTLVYSGKYPASFGISKHSTIVRESSKEELWPWFRL